MLLKYSKKQRKFVEKQKCQDPNISPEQIIKLLNAEVTKFHQLRTAKKTTHGILTPPQTQKTKKIFKAIFIISALLFITSLISIFLTKNALSLAISIFSLACLLASLWAFLKIQRSGPKGEKNIREKNLISKKSNLSQRSCNYSYDVEEGVPRETEEVLEFVRKAENAKNLNSGLKSASVHLPKPKHNKTTLALFTHLKRNNTELKNSFKKIPLGPKFARFPKFFSSQQIFPLKKMLTKIQPTPNWTPNSIRKPSRPSSSECNTSLFS
jgi:ATP-dependent Zn protease